LPANNNNQKNLKEKNFALRSVGILSPQTSPSSESLHPHTGPETVAS
jgi:hypothetical protein